MKTAVVYYSYDGSTKVAAEVLAQKLDADIFELEEVKARGHKPSAFMGAAFAALLGLKSRLTNAYGKEMAACERICIGTPIWARKSAPAVNAFVGRTDVAGKDVIIFTVQADKSPETNIGAANAMKKKLEKRGAAVSRIMTLIGEQPGKTVSAGNMEKQIDEKMNEDR